MIWSQEYDPLGLPWLSTIMAALPLAVLLGTLAILRWRAPLAALAGLAAALVVAIGIFGMPATRAFSAAGFGAAYGLLPIGWIVLNIIFLYQLTLETGQFAVLRDSIAGITADSRLQLLLIAFCFGAFFEGAAGFGAPVAVTGAMLIGLGFPPLQAAGLSLIANTAPVAFGALGTPLVTLAGVTDLPLLDLSRVVGRIMTPFSILVPAWLLMAYCGWRRTLEVWPAVVVVGVSFAIAQLAISNLHGPWLTAIGASLTSIASLVLLLRFWKPRTRMVVEGQASQTATPDRRALQRAWLPWLILVVLVFIWGLPQIKAWLDGVFRIQWPFPGLDRLVQRMPPVVARPETERALLNINLLSATGTAILLSGIVAGLALRLRITQVARIWARSLVIVSPSLLTISAMLGLGYLTRYAGVDATLGLAFAATGALYPFFGTLLGWLGVAVTGSDTASNVLFGGLQKVTSQQLGLSPVLMAGANSAGGVMGKMIDAQSIVVASTATRWFGQEGVILRYVFVHSIVLASLVGLVVLLMAKVPPFTLLVPGSSVAERAATIRDLAALLPKGALLSTPEDTRPWECDGLTLLRQRPLAVALPANRAQLVALLAYCAGHQVPVVPRGAGTGLAGSALPLADGLLLSMARFNRILDIDPLARTATVEPGVRNLAISEAAAIHGLFYAPDPSSQIACTIGGNVAENSGGVHCLKYGLTLHNVLRVRALTLQGEELEFGGLAPDAPGLDLLPLVIGSEGMLAVTTEVTVRLLPRPAVARCIMASFADVADAGDAVAALIAAGIIPAGLEMLDQAACRLVEPFVNAGYDLDAAAVLLCESDGSTEEVEEEIERMEAVLRQARATRLAVSRDEAERARFWAGRKNAFPAAGRAAPAYYCTDGTIPRRHIGRMLKSIQAMEVRYGLRCPNVFHAGDGNLHPLVLFDDSDPDSVARAEAFGAEILEECLRCGGTITGEHGVGMEKINQMCSQFDRPTLDAFAGVKRAFDPSGLLNPGKVIPSLHRCAEYGRVRVTGGAVAHPELPRF